MTARRALHLGVATVGLALAVSACGSSSKSTSSTTTPTTGATSAAATSGPALTKAAIKIGVVGTFSGFAGVTSKATADSAQAWAQATNASGGINGHPVQVVVKDDQADPSKSIAAVKDLVENEHVIALIQHDSGLEASWESYVDAKKVPVVGASGTGTVWLTDPNFFPVTSNSKNDLTLTLYTTALAGKKGYGIVYCAEVPACAQAGSASAAIAQALHITYAGGLALSASAPNYTSQCLSLRAKGAESVFTATSIETAKRFIADCARQGFKPIWIDNPQNWTAAETSNPVWEGAWLAADSIPWTSPKMADYRDAMQKYAPTSPLNSSGTAGWASGMVLAKALANVGDTPTSQDVYSGLYGFGPNFDAGGLIPAVTYAQGKPPVQKTCMWFLQVKGGQLTAPKGTDAVCLGA
jgi:branched-chain amino acid transport system substrate-binding protein